MIDTGDKKPSAVKEKRVPLFGADALKAYNQAVSSQQKAQEEQKFMMG